MTNTDTQTSKFKDTPMKHKNKLLHISLQLFFSLHFLHHLPQSISTSTQQDPATCHHNPYPHHHHRSDKCLAHRALRVPHSRKQVLPPIKPIRIITRPGHLIHQGPARVPRIRPAPKHAGTRRHRLQRRRSRALKIPIIKRVGNRACKQCGQINHHPVDTDVSIRRH